MDPAVCIALGSLAVSLGVAVRGEVRARRSERRAERAEARSDRAEATAERLRISQLWGEVIAQVQPLASIVLPAPDLGDRLIALRSATVELVDGVKPDEWPGLDLWLSSEHRLGPVLGHAVLESLGPDGLGDPSDVLAAHEPLHSWAHAYMSNLRRFRRIGPGNEASDALPKLLNRADENMAAICAKHGWPVPGPPALIKPLDDSPT